MGEETAMQLRPLAEHDLPLILEWRNHPEVRRVMFTGHEISPEEHRAWWMKFLDDPSRQVLLGCIGGRPLGVVNFFDIDSGDGSCHWGFYLDNASCPSAAERLSIWLQLEQAAIEHAFGALKCRKLLCETLETNRAVLQLHRKFGFREIETFLREKEGEQVKVVRMALENEPPAPPPAARQLRLAFLGSANWDLAGRDFSKRYIEITGEQAETLPIPFGQYRQQLWDERSSLRTATLDYWVFCERLEDLLDNPFSTLDATQSAALEKRFEEYLGLLARARELLTGTFLVLDLAPVRPFCATLEDTSYNKGSLRELVSRFNRRLWAFCATSPDCHLVNLSALVEEWGARTADPGKYWLLGRIPYNGTFAGELNLQLIRTVLALRGKTSRVIVVDLDNTLWGGVIGDDGLAGIRIGGDFPGNAFVQIQQILRAFRERGIALAICSKNTEAVAMEALQTHPGMVLRPAEFTSMRINWRDKGENIREIAEEIGVGLSSVCFLDDSPYEREAVRRLLPEVTVPELPADVTLWPAFFLSHPMLASLRLTAEDRERAERYAVRARINREAAACGSKEEYWRSLGMRLSFQRLAPTNRQRVLQLLSKTNQFNMTTRRHGERDLEKLVTRGAEIIAISLADKYSEQEIIGVIILLPLEGGPATMQIETFLLSCRVLGRSVETGILGWICACLKQRGVAILEGLFLKTDRNLPASRTYEEHGFVSAGEGRYRLDLRFSPVPVPSWFDISEEACP